MNQKKCGKKARSKALADIARIRRNFTCIDKRAFYVLYNQRIRPHLDYGMTACPSGSSAASKMLEVVHSKATAVVLGLKILNSEGKRKKLGLMTHTGIHMPPLFFLLDFTIITISYAKL